MLPVHIHVAAAVYAVEQHSDTPSFVLFVHPERLPVPTDATGQMPVASAQLRIEIQRNAPVVRQLYVLPSGFRHLHAGICPVVGIQDELPIEIKILFFPHTVMGCGHEWPNHRQRQYPPAPHVLLHHTFSSFS